MRIAYVCADRGVPVFGVKGSSNHVQEVVRVMAAQGAEVEIFASRIGGSPPPGLDGVTVHRLPRGPHASREEKERSALASNVFLRDALAAAGPFDMVYERHSLWSYAGMEYARHHHLPGLLEVNSPLIEEQRRYRELVLEKEATQSVARAFRAASALLGVSEGVARYLRSHAAVRSPVHVVPNGVDPDRFAPPPATSGWPRPFCVGFVGTLKPWHAVDDLIDAFATLRSQGGDARLLIVGDGPQRHILDMKVTACGLNHAVEFHGTVAPAEVPSLLASMDVAVAPYPQLADFYFSPLKLFEYMAAGRAIVAAAIGQIDRLVADGVTGLLYPPGDTAALTTALGRLMADEALRSRLGSAAREVAIRDHTWHAAIRRIFELAEAHSPTRSTMWSTG